ncbi:MAG: carbamoyl phosphate synthase small subunit, partial [Chloroflexi bacterium]|nr:carbamoyl phosphate synthase small subunit [Chloroflexota bacterium]
MTPDERDAAYLILEDGAVFAGERLGAEGMAVGEVVFNTSMTGYQEMLTDPSYGGQILVPTYPMIGNYGINDDDFESDRLQPAGIIVREACEKPSNWRSKKTINALLKERNMVGIQGIDTRMLTKRIRSAGVTMGCITTGDPDEAIAHLKTVESYDEQNFVAKVTTEKPYAWGKSFREEIGASDEGYKARVVVLDCGLKFNILRRLANLHVRSIVVPASTSADEVMSYKPDGILLSPGPGDPVQLDEV